ncbi:hypothetical protein CGRA01v4_03822 [Colletotrichum graminicola]|nr:hypothetical protein CGRA01v4_03822 [Colletotrichum graminicola]
MIEIPNRSIVMQSRRGRWVNERELDRAMQSSVLEANQAKPIWYISSASTPTVNDQRQANSPFFLKKAFGSTPQICMYAMLSYTEELPVNSGMLSSARL